jgi:hypothetical protein
MGRPCQACAREGRTHQMVMVDTHMGRFGPLCLVCDTGRCPTCHRPLYHPKATVCFCGADIGLNP